MANAMKAKPWPNNLGWDVGRAAEVWRFDDGSLGVNIQRLGRTWKYMRVQNEKDPVAAVEICRRHGTPGPDFRS